MMKIPMVMSTWRCGLQGVELQPHEGAQSVWQSQGLQEEGLQPQGLQGLQGLQQPQPVLQLVLQSTIRQPNATGALTCRHTLGIPPF